MEGLYSSVNLSSLKEMFPTRTEEDLSNFLLQYPGHRLEGLVEIILNESGFSCGICFEMDKLIHEIVSCPGGHFFCKDCARKGCEGLVQGSRIVYKCFEPKCEEAFDTQTLSELINPKLFSKYVQGICKEEIKSCFKLEDCPECDYGVVIEDESIMIIECQYEFCGVRSCRRCKKRAHKLGESCSLSDSDNHFVANKMSEAVIRRCYSCKKPYQKFEGCNSVKCECGAKMCYICRTPLKGGYHNNRSRECSSSVNMVSLHEIERRKAEEEARSSLGATGTSFANL